MNTIQNIHSLFSDTVGKEHIDEIIYKLNQIIDLVNKREKLLDDHEERIYKLENPNPWYELVVWKNKMLFWANPPIGGEDLPDELPDGEKSLTN